MKNLTISISNFIPLCDSENFIFYNNLYNFKKYIYICRFVKFKSQITLVLKLFPQNTLYYSNIAI